MYHFTYPVAIAKLSVDEPSVGSDGRCKFPPSLVSLSFLGSPHWLKHARKFEVLLDAESSMSAVEARIVENAQEDRRSRAFTSFEAGKTKEMFETGFIHIANNIVAFCNKRGHCESNMFVTLDFLTKMKRPTHSINLL